MKDFFYLLQKILNLNANLICWEETKTRSREKLGLLNNFVPLQYTLFL